jgi:hypothetical protein
MRYQHAMEAASDARKGWVSFWFASAFSRIAASSSALAKSHLPRKRADLEPRSSVGMPGKFLP